ncbi:FtsW/RodA/SpoVE family cell cycle protein [Paenibacillus sacheonensis]|uniref:FtsW/RodA/SpoVE family cell cycle protein n=1 Tax=Paenibacillus sacheonensis TaxID=742054 RepID=A0A7X4YVW6_9BACL|nr:FtsW/RodA/SpoVE family cell cycle protein [Paenibacillus sacheonensis]MBM7566636.1 cell division protein FtsW (lipid II flippase) [Paenibacillus sacheonensis]NBC73552.1 FtsW/RodA/SpoVE family cell cycle protein [Paenibacillus sacheonensis]
MTEIGRHADVARYLDRICAPIKARSMHEEIRLEMLSHLEALAEERFERGGCTEEEAIQDALLQMGDPDQVGRQLHAAHRPKPEWSVIALAGCLLLLGLVTMFSLDLALGGRLSVPHKMLAAVIGIGAMCGLYFADYRKLARYSWSLYAGMLLLLAYTLSHGLMVNGAKQWIGAGAFVVNAYAAAPYVLLMAVAGMLHRERPIRAGNRIETLGRLMRGAAAYVALPTCFFAVAPAFGPLLVYLIGLAALLVLNGRWKMLLSGIGAIAVLLLYVQQRYNRDLWLSIWERQKAFFHRGNAGDYHTIRSLDAIHSGGWWGQGFGRSLGTLPDIMGEFTYSYLVYSLGWVFGVAAALIALVFVVRLVRMGMRLPAGYAKSLVICLAAVMGVQYVWNLLMCVGLLPSIGGMQLPILNWNANTIVELGALGFILGAYRRKDMLNGRSRRAVPQ